MTTTKTSTKPAKSFTRTIDGATIHYRRTEKGYCYMGTARIKAAEFEQAEIEAMKERQERNEAVAARLRRSAEESTRIEREEESMNIIEIDGVKWGKDLDGTTYRDGVKCKKADFNRALGISQSSEHRPRARKPKDVGFEHEGVTLTAKQADFLRELSAAGQDGVLGNAKTGWWCDCIADGIGGQFAGKPMTVGAMISTLCEKGLAERAKERRDKRMVTSFSLTEDGRKIWKAIGLK